MEFAQITRVWQRPFTGATLLYLINRYGTPLEILIVVIAFHAHWDPNVCLPSQSSLTTRHLLTHSLGVSIFLHAMLRY